MAFEPTIRLDMELIDPILQMNFSLIPYIDAIGNFNYPAFPALSAYPVNSSFFHYGTCSNPHLVEYNVQVGLSYNIGINVLDGEYENNFPGSVFEFSLLSGCLLTQMSPTVSLQVLLTKSLIQLGILSKERMLT